MSVTVIIPTYRPGDKFRRLMEKLKSQTVSPDKIIIMNTEERFWDDRMIRGVSQAEVYHISKKEFDHGRTRAPVSYTHLTLPTILRV